MADSENPDSDSSTDSETMKSGTGSDPFDDEADGSTGGEQANSTTKTTGDEAAKTENHLGGIEETPIEEPDAVGKVPFEDAEFPLKMARENVKSSRDGKVLQISSYAGTVERSVDAQKEVNSALNDKMSTMDFKEAVYLAGLANLDDVYRILQVWGYDNDDSLFG